MNIYIYIYMIIYHIYNIYNITYVYYNIYVHIYIYIIIITTAVNGQKHKTNLKSADRNLAGEGGAIYFI